MSGGFKGKRCMHVLHYIYGVEPFRTGGLISYAFDLAQTEAEMGYNISILVPGNINRRNVKIKKIKSCRGLNTYRISKALPIPLTKGISDEELFVLDEGYDEYKNFLKTRQIDVIHVHSLMGVHRSFLKAAKDSGIRVIFTSHDYYGLCPCTNLYKIDHNCDEKDWLNCSECNKDAFGKLHLVIDQSYFFQTLMKTSFAKKMIKKLSNAKQIVNDTHEQDTSRCESSTNRNLKRARDYYFDMLKMVDYFHFNSMVAKKVFEYRFSNIRGSVIPISSKRMHDNRKKRECFEIIRFGYLGPNNSQKGYFKLIEVLDKLYRQYDKFQLNTYFGQEKNVKEWQISHDPYNINDLEKVMDQNDIIVVPSLWKETFGLVVLEAISYGVPVIVTDNVGAAMILDSASKPIGEVISSDDLDNNLFNALIKLTKNPSIINEWNSNILKEDFSFSFKNHVNQVIKECYVN